MTCQDQLTCSSVHPRSRALVLSAAAAITLTLFAFHTPASSAAGVVQRTSRYFITSITSGTTATRYRRHRSDESSTTSTVVTPTAVLPDDNVVPDMGAAVFADYCRGGTGSFGRVARSSDSEGGKRWEDVEQPVQRPLKSNDNQDALVGRGCCLGRDDRCWRPFLETICYCDEFCERRATPDCCPDFQHHCVGRVRYHQTRRPDGESRISRKSRAVQLSIHDEQLHGNNGTATSNECEYEGEFYKRGQMIKQNCNNCTCVDFLTAEGSVEISWQCSRKMCAVRSELIQEINNRSRQPIGWLATNYTSFWGLTLDEVVRRWTGTEKPLRQPPPPSLATPSDGHLSQLASNNSEFDSRRQWPGLATQLSGQQSCGSSWLYATAGVVFNRLVLEMSERAAREMPSIQDLVECIKTHHCRHSSNCNSCQRGNVEDAWRFVKHIRVVNTSTCTMLDLHSNSSSHSPSDSHSNSDSSDMCILQSVTSDRKPLDLTPCSQQSSILSHDFGVSAPYRVPPHEPQIMSEILHHGPVQAIIEVKEDFLMYKTGVYRYSMPANYLPENKRISRHHAVNILGWGVDYSTGKPLKYWLCSNSWGEHWGENGYFRIIRGTDESGIESFILGSSVTMATNKFSV